MNPGVCSVQNDFVSLQVLYLYVFNSTPITYLIDHYNLSVWITALASYFALNVFVILAMEGLSTDNFEKLFITEDRKPQKKKYFNKFHLVEAGVISTWALRHVNQHSTRRQRFRSEMITLIRVVRVNVAVILRTHHNTQRLKIFRDMFLFCWFKRVAGISL